VTYVFVTETPAPPSPAGVITTVIRTGASLAGIIALAGAISFAVWYLLKTSS